MFSRLGSPLAIGPVELPNRIVSTAHQTTLVHEHLPTEDFVAYHEARARGGVGLIVLEAAAIHASGLLTSHTIGGYLPEIVDGYRRSRPRCSRRTTRLFVQLFHGGREQIASAPRARARAVRGAERSLPDGAESAARADELEEIVAGFARWGGAGSGGGLDGVEVSAAHRYLIEQFFDPALNRREDAWATGARFLGAVLRAIRASAPALALGVRVSATRRTGARSRRWRSPKASTTCRSRSASPPRYLGSVGIVPPPPVPKDVVAEHAAAFRSGHRSSPPRASSIPNARRRSSRPASRTRSG